MIDFSRIKAMALKEYLHIIRDKFTIALGLFLPVFFILFFGFIIELNYDNLSLFVIDNSSQKQSRQLVNSFSSSRYFNPVYINEADALIYLEENRTAAIMIIDKDFSKNISLAKSADIQILIDASDNAKAALISSYIPAIVKKAQSVLYPQNNSFQYDIRTRFLFNPQIDSKWFIVPGLIVIIVGLLSILLTSLTIAKEWERGSMELLLSTHIQPIEIVLGKIFPYFILSAFGAFLVFVAARLVFAVPFTGSIICFFISCCIYIIACLAFGILISAITRQQQLAMMISMAAGMLPSILLSGFIFPIENMPLIFRAATYILPQRWFMIICRASFLKEAGFSDLILPLFMICAFCLLMIFAASKKFKKDLEI
jgi:ABC-2 type transport system permease protein